jgi:hypothetical protein
MDQESPAAGAPEGPVPETDDVTNDEHKTPTHPVPVVVQMPPPAPPVETPASEQEPPSAPRSSRTLWIVLGIAWLVMLGVVFTLLARVPADEPLPAPAVTSSTTPAATPSPASSETQTPAPSPVPTTSTTPAPSPTTTSRPDPSTSLAPVPVPTQTDPGPLPGSDPKFPGPPETPKGGRSSR